MKPVRSLHSTPGSSTDHHMIVLRSKNQNYIGQVIIDEGKARLLTR